MAAGTAAGEYPADAHRRHAEIACQILLSAAVGLQLVPDGKLDPGQVAHCGTSVLSALVNSRMAPSRSHSSTSAAWAPCRLTAIQAAAANARHMAACSASLAALLMRNRSASWRPLWSWRGTPTRPGRAVPPAPGPSARPLPV